MLLPPKVQGPINSLATSVTVLGALDGAAVQLFVNGAPCRHPDDRERSVGRGQPWRDGAGGRSEDHGHPEPRRRDSASSRHFLEPSPPRRAPRPGFPQ